MEIIKRIFHNSPTKPASSSTDYFFTGHSPSSTSLTPTSPDQLFLPVPSSSWPVWRPPCNLCPSRDLTQPRKPLERAAARICREAGARVTTNTRIIDLNIDHVDTQDDRRIKVIANGLPLWGRAQLAVDTTLVSPLTRAGHPRMRGGQYRGTALREARRNKERTYPELLWDRRCRLVVLGIEVRGRWSDEAPRPHQSPPSPSPSAPLPHQRPHPPLERHAHACCSIPPFWLPQPRNQRLFHPRWSHQPSRYSRLPAPSWGDRLGLGPLLCTSGSRRYING